MKYTKPMKVLTAVMATLCTAFLLPGCEDASNLGGSLVMPDVAINVDSNFNITAESFHQADFDSRSSTMLLGAVDMDGIGNYSSSIVTQLMAATKLSMPDSIILDSISGMALKLSFRKGALTGDSLAPCQLKVFRLNKQLPSGILSSFDPTGYYDPTAPLGVKNYTASILGVRDSTAADSYTHLRVNLPVELGRQVVQQYRKDASIFQWPQTFNRYFPGLYIENTFGKGCMVNITVAEVAVYYQRKIKSVEIVNDTAVSVVKSHRDSVTLFSTAPEVLSSNNLRMTIAQPIRDMVEQQKKVVVMSPCGYLASIRIPARELVDRYNSTDFDLAVVNNLILTIPARTIANNYNLRPAPNLLLVRRKDMMSFFAENKIPDATKMSFYGTYDSSTGLYTFTSMRDYIVDLLEAGGTVSEEDMDFVLIPVAITTEYNAIYNTTYVTGCFPYIYTPTICELDMEKAKLKFTFGTKN